MARRGPYRINWYPMGNPLLLAILKPLALLKALVFKIELNVEIREEVLRGLGKVNFTALFRERPG